MLNVRHSSFAAAILLPPSSRFSFGIVFCLLAILAMSGWVFRVLTHQWTTRRPIQALLDWASDRKFKLRFPPEAALPAALIGLKSVDPQVHLLLQGETITLLRLTTKAKPAGLRPHWHLLIRESGHPWNPAGLRPAHAAASFLDLFSLSSFPSVLPPERFIAMGGQTKDARQIATSPARGLLPADIGLMVHGPYLTLDFSSRPFDAIEFERMLTIMDQLVAHFPM
jgi:hypothetical protein